MDYDYPIDDTLVVLKSGQRIGPLSIEEVLGLLEEGTLSYQDICLREGSAECERLCDVLDWEKEDESNDEEPEEVFDDEEEEEQFDELPEQEEESSTQPEAPTESPTNAGQPINPMDLPPTAILYRGHPSILTHPFALFMIVSGIGFGLWFHATSIWITIGGFFLALLAFAALAFERTLCLYIITPRRVEIVTGFIAKSSNEARISDIRSINVSREGFNGMLGVGTVEFFTTGDESEVTFTDVWSARKVKSLVRKIQDT